MAPTVWLSQSCVEVTSVGVVAYQVEPGGGTGRGCREARPQRRLRRRQAAHPHPDWLDPPGGGRLAAKYSTLPPTPTPNWLDPPGGGRLSGQI